MKRILGRTRSAADAGLAASRRAAKSGRRFMIRFPVEIEAPRDTRPPRATLGWNSGWEMRILTGRGSPVGVAIARADAVVSPLASDGDFGEQRVTVLSPAGFAVG